MLRLIRWLFGRREDPISRLERKTKEIQRKTAEFHAKQAPDKKWSKKLERHFELTEIIRKHYPQRKQPKHMKIVVDACYEMIAISSDAAYACKRISYFKKVPINLGYEKLCIIRHQEGNYAEVIKLARQAKKQGWAGTWDNRIKRAQKKMKNGG